MTKTNAKQRAVRVPSAKGFKDVLPSMSLFRSTDPLFSAVPKNYSLWSAVPPETMEGYDLGAIQVDNFPMCCGAGIAHSFAYSNGLSSKQKDQAIAEIERRLQAQQRGIGMLIVNDTQLKYWDTVLFNRGWECVTASSNPVHYNKTIVYLFTKTFGAVNVELPKKKSVAA